MPLPNKQIIRVHIVHHPVEASNVTVVELPFRNQSLEEIKHKFTNGQEVLCVIEGTEISQADWARTYPPADSRVVFGPAVCDPITMFIFKMTIGQLLWAIAINLAIMIGLSYLGGLLFGPDMKQPKGVGQEREEGQSFGWNPITTQQEGIPHPMCYGTNMHYGNVVARWTDVDESGDEILYMVLDYGRGPVQGRGANIVYLDDQPSGNFPSVSIQERLGTLNQTCMTGFEKNKLEYRPGWKITYDDGPATFVTPNNFFDDLEYTIEFPRGLWHYGDDGSRVAHGVGVKVQISERGLSAWTTLMDTTINGDQLAPVYKAYKVSEQSFDCDHSKQYDLKYFKTSEDKGIDRYGDELVLRSVREVVDVAFTRPGKALLGVTALATERLSGHINVKWVADDKLVRVYNGTSWGVAFTRNRAWIDLDALTQPVISGDGGANPWTIERYEGLDPSQTDLAFFYEWAEWCDDQVPSGVGEETEDRMPCDIIVDWQTDVWTLAYEIAQVGRMYPYWQGNILTGWVDKVVTDEPVDLITFDNVMVRSWRNAWAGYGEISGSIEVFYKDALLGYERKGLPISNELAGKYTRIVSVEGTGVTGRALAIRVGNHMLERNKLIKNFNSCRMYKDALRHRLGSLVRLQSNVPNWGKAYRVVKSEADNTVELDRTCDAEADEIIYVRSYDETNKRVDIGSYTVASVAGKVVTIAETWDVSPIKNNSVAIGVAGKIKLRRIIKMRYTADNYFDVEFETYDATLFDSDDVPPVIDNPDYEWPQPAPDLGKPVTKWEVIDLISQMVPPSPDIEIPWISNCNWTGNEVDTITWAKRNADEPILFRYRGVTYNITPDNTTDEFVYWDPNYTTQFRTTNVASVALAAGMWLVCTNEDGVPHPATPMQLLHAAIILAGTIRANQYAELRNTYVYNNEDSLDQPKPFTVPFKIVSEMTAIQSVKLSFKLLPYRAYATAASDGGASTSGDGGAGVKTSSDGGGQTSSGATGWPTTVDTSTVDPGDTDNEDLGSHYHTMPSHDHDLSGSTETENGAESYTGFESNGSHRHTIGGTSHSHNLSYSSGVSSEDPGDTYATNLYSHHHSMPTHKHTVGLLQHTHTVDDHTHTVTLTDHTHSTPNHTHGVTYGIHEESNSPTVHFHVDNGAGFGDPSDPYTSDQTDLDITSLITTVGWKAIRFDTNLRCRIASILECKLDITA